MMTPTIPANFLEQSHKMVSQASSMDALAT